MTNQNETVYCANCGNAFTEDEGFCTGCGEKRESKLPTAPANQETYVPTQAPNTTASNALLATVAYKGNGEAVQFYDDHLEYAGNIIGYADIAVMDTHAVIHSGYAAIIWYSSYDGYVRFTMTNSQKYKIPVKGMSVFSIGTTRSAKKRFPPLFNAVYKIVAQAMAVNALSHIKSGSTVSIAGLDITNEGASHKKLLKKEPIYINRENFGNCGLDGYNVRVLDKQGNKLIAISDAADNALLLPYVLTTLFG